MDKGNSQPLSGKKINIAIDGYSSCGKSTLAKALAEKLHYVYIDSGAMYRAVTLYAMEQGLIKDNFLDVASLIEELDEIKISFKREEGQNQADTFLNEINVEKDIRGMGVSRFVSKLSSIPEIRKKLVHWQQEYGTNKGVVMDGRDIGTAVFPDAEVKIFLEADEDIRIERRFSELQSKGITSTYSEVRENIKLRDYNDTHREESPLLMADDSFLLNNSEINQEEQLEIVLNLVNHQLEELELIRENSES